MLEINDEQQHSKVSSAFRCREYLLYILYFLLFAGSLMVLKTPFQKGSSLPEWFWIAGTAVLLLSTFYFIFLAVSTLFSPDWPDALTGETLPGITVIVPAYNEGIHVYYTIKELLQNGYPAEKLEIISVNDGSMDNTLYFLHQAKLLAPDQVKVIDIPENRGKKHALCRGIREAAFDFIVTVDSDTIICHDGLFKIVQPFADPQVGAVAGTISGKEENLNFHCKMLDVMLVFGCEFLRRAQAARGNVFCTPGALSAYRKSALLPLLDKWLDQSFLGVPASIGEDRAVATLLLENHWHVVHRKEAEARTCLPEYYTGVCKMLLRWTRSDIRENFLMTPTVLRGLFRDKQRGFNLFLHWISLSINMFLPFVFLPLTVYMFAASGSILFSCALLFVSSAVWSLIPGLIYCRKKHSVRVLIWGIIFGIYSVLGLSWIAVFAFFTVRNSRWLTRDIR